jgi:hypothetical protein
MAAIHPFTSLFSPQPAREMAKTHTVIATVLESFPHPPPNPFLGGFFAELSRNFQNSPSTFLDRFSVLILNLS